MTARYPGISSLCPARPHPRSQSHLAGHGGGLEEGGGPGPLGHDGGGGQADGDLAPSIKGGVEVVSIVVDMFTNLKTSGQVFVVSDLEECRQEMKDFFDILQFHN